jgi:nucleoid DNA-binding protein
MAKTAKISDLAEYVSKKTGMKPRDAREGIKTTFDGIAALLKKNDRVSITGIGIFAKTVKPAQRGGQKAINPFTKEPYVTKPRPAQTKVKFRPGKGFKQGFGGK